MRSKNFLMAAALCALQPLHALTLVVAKSGGAYATVQAGLNAAMPGDTVLVKAGVYEECVAFPRSGGFDSLITLRGEPGAVLDGNNAKAQALVSIRDRSNIRVTGLELRNLKGTGLVMGIEVRGQGRLIRIEKNLVHHIESTSDAHGIAVYGEGIYGIIGVTLDGNEVRDCKLGSSESMVLNGNVTVFTVSNNVVHDNDNIGIDFIGHEGTAPDFYDEVSGGNCFGNRVYNISSAKNPAYGGDRSADGIYVDGGEDIFIQHNVVDNCDIAFEVASEHAGKRASGILLAGNFASRSYQANIMIGGYAADRGMALAIDVIGNTTWHGNGGEVLLQFNCRSIRVKHNVLVASGGNAYVTASGGNDSAVEVDNNLYFGASASSAGLWSDAHARFGDPLLAAAPGNLHILAGSPAIDAAIADGASGGVDIDGEPRVNGPAMDLGADEYQSATAVLAPARPLRPAPWRSRDWLGRLIPISAKRQRQGP